MNRAGDRPLCLRFRLTAAACGLACFAAAHVLAGWPSLVERGYAHGVAPVLVGTLSRATGLVPFSLAEWVIAAFVLRQLVGAAAAVRQVLRRRRGAANALAAGGLRLGSDLGLAVALFYVLWGFHYARPPLEERLGWPAGVEIRPSAEELAALAEHTVAAANAAYVELHGVVDLGVPTPGPGDAAEVERAVEAGWARVDGALPGVRVPDRRYGRAKRPLLAPVLSRLSLAGFFFPWTGEANVNGDMPAVSVPQAMAHEKAHQRGFAPEDEAGFLGFVAASGADDPLVRYSAALFAQRRILAALRPLDPGAFERAVEARLPGVRRDLDDVDAYWRRFRGPASVAAERVNDAYLRSNRVEEGTRSYGMSLALLVEYARRRGGRLAVAPDGGPPGPG